MNRWLNLFFCMVVLFASIDAAKKRIYTTGISDLIRRALNKGVKRFITRQTSYDSDVFRYTQLSRNGLGGLYAGESCRLSPSMCSYDEHCCSGRCLCRRWTITGEERCVRKCL